VLADPQRVPTKTQLSLVLRAVAALGQYLDDLMAGEPNLPLALMPLFRELSVVQGVAHVSESELFFPDLRIRPPRHPAGNPLSDRDLPEFVKIQRSRFQRGMLSWLKDAESGLPAMREALAAVERAQPLPHQRGFWWAGVGLMDALIAKGLANSVGVKKLCARIEQQMRAVGEGAILVSERLLRDVLFHIARAEPITERVSEVKQLYRLDQYLATPRQAQAPRVELDRVQPVLREIRELLRVAKDAWVKYSSGNGDTLSAFRDYAGKLDATVRQLGEPTLARLTQMVQRTATVLPAGLTQGSEEVFLEMATALLVAEGAVERYGRPSPQLAAQVDAISARLAAALAPAGPSQPLPEVNLLDEVGRKAQEKMLAAQVVNEIQSNLREIEQVLDSFFREPERRTALPQLKPIIRQVLGALNVMGQDTATKLLAECAATIERCSAANHKSTQQELELLADGLSSLSLYIDALKQNQTIDARMIEIVLARFTPGAEPVQPEPEEAPRRTLEAALEEEKLNAHQLLNTWHLRPDDAAVKRELKQSLEVLHQGATLVENRQLLERTEAALTQLKAADLGPDASLKQAISTITGFLPPGIAQAAELAAAGKEAIDKELLSTYLEEAQEVLKNVHEQLALCRTEPHNLDALTTIRRGFHTLKGSGRMVGLTDLGEAAWGVEQVMNQWLQLERNATPLLLEYLSLAHAYFQGWIGALSERGWVQVDAARLMQLAEQVKASVEPQVDSPQPAPVQEQREAAGIPQPPVDAVEAIEPGTAGAVASDEATTVVGCARVPSNLLSLYIDEAGKHLDTLKQEFNTWRGQPAQAPTQEF
ncbi:MAG TPA: Hpt domain-containing protein, partial [Burkholderiales bacterium]|nr:Hpt domain-containing protein [Burkholderiales bacterium]